MPFGGGSHGRRKEKSFKLGGASRTKDMARNKDSGFHSAAGLIRYFDQEDEKALKIPPFFVVALCVILSAIILYVTFAWPV